VPLTLSIVASAIVFGERHMNHLVGEMVAYYHESRPHQAKDNDLLVPAENAKKGEEPDVLLVRPVVRLVALRRDDAIMFCGPTVLGCGLASRRSTFCTGRDRRLRPHCLQTGMVPRAIIVTMKSIRATTKKLIRSRRD
jgi:hypothetical protein